MFHFFSEKEVNIFVLKVVEHFCNVLKRSISFSLNQNVPYGLCYLVCSLKGSLAHDERLYSHRVLNGISLFSPKIV